jgi:hypothetical protein
VNLQKNPSKVNKQNLRSISTLMLPVLSVAMVAYVGSVMWHNSSAAPSTSPQTNSSVQLPAAGRSSCCRITVNQLGRNPADSQDVQVSVNVFNSGQSTVQISPGLQMLLQDKLGTSHSYTAEYLPPGQTVGGPLAPGENRTETLDFKLPVDAAPAAFIFQENAGANPAKIGL